jgi:hypothetical protein
MNNLKYMLAWIKAEKLPLFILFLASFLPLLFNYPFRFNVFLAWDAAYRLSIGHVPYRDFGLPLGIGFWILPALFFKVLGSDIFNLIIFQSIVNFVAGFVFYRIALIFEVKKWIAVSSLLIFVLSYSMANPWPWYNHLVFVFQLLSLYFLLQVLIQKKHDWWWLGLSSFFAVWSIFTKQDGGFFALLINGSLLLYHAWVEKKFKSIVIYAIATIFFLLIWVLPFINYEMGYWFNYGQAPHFSRVTFLDIINEFLGASQWLKFYFFMLVLAFAVRQERCTNHQYHVMVILVLGILVQATFIQVTSYTPINGNIYFHSFAFLLIAHSFFQSSRMDKNIFLQYLMYACICLWWSGEYWNRQLKHKVERYFSTDSYDPSKVVSKNTYMLDKLSKAKDRADWVLSDLPTFKHIKLPKQTIAGIKKIRDLQVISSGNFKILNMSELTMLAQILPYEPEKGKPLWYHQNVSIFDKEIKEYNQEIKAGKYDLVIYQIIPGLNNFYPPEIKDYLEKYYQKSFEFLAPRAEENSTIEVYLRKTVLD